LKRILASNLPMPDTVVVPEKLHHFHSSQASLEFPLYHFLFVQRGLERRRRFQVVATGRQCEGLAEMLRVTVVGPTAEEMVKAGTPAQLAQEIAQETHYMALKKPGSDGKAAYPVKEMINFIPMSPGEQAVIYPVRQMLAEIRLERTGPAAYRVLFGEESYDIDLTVTAEQAPSYALHHVPFDHSAGKFTMAVLGRSNGFDPKDPANGYLFNVDGKIVLWDCPAYLHQHLKQLKVDPKSIDAFILSHVHEDHIDVSESLRDPPFELYCTPEVYYSLLVKLAAVYSCRIEEAKKYHNWHRIEVGKPTEICGAQWLFFNSVHAIPAIGCRVTKEVKGKRGTLHLSGDHLSNEALARMHEQGGISARRYEHVTHLITGEESLVLVDAGGGAIHGDFRDHLNLPGRVGFMHTGLIQDKLPEGKELVTSGQVLDITGG
ncbi:MAG TPA: MBL fold metallo-hydrolase, partial [bacterium]